MRPQKGEVDFSPAAELLHERYGRRGGYPRRGHRRKHSQRIEINSGKLT